MAEAAFASSGNLVASLRTRPFSIFAVVGGFLYWLTFLLFLEPGNVLVGLAHGGISPVKEALRIVAASSLGAAATPSMLYFYRRYPLAWADRWPNFARLAIVVLVLPSILVTTGTLLARPLLRQDHRALGVALLHELIGNGPLVSFAITAFLTLAHAFGSSKGNSNVSLPPSQDWIKRVAIKSRGVTEIVELDAIDWIETQGNYLALHGPKSVWLLRETSASFEAKLDPARFTRIHRRTLVSIERVRTVAALNSGDAMVFLKDGTTLRMSRTYNDRLLALREL